ncbi:MAG TPA: histidine kinase dimerization/phospho-acceptor domain-containing protein, partial [Candidatus Binatia bacterium]|nr:histidine kinase dimerization/phospho-acceptor domain-containing protein [Candidatus Binatia bacterium]
GEAIIESRSQERLRLKEELSRADHLSSLGKLTAGISHEIRNPLGIIRSSAEHLQKKMAHLDPENRIPHIIVEEAGRLNDIITDFLNYARPKEPKRVSCRVEDIIMKNLAFLDAQLTEKGYVVEKHLDRRLPAILADADMLYQAFLNILINAMQAMPEGGRLQITTEMINQRQGHPGGEQGKNLEPVFHHQGDGHGSGFGDRQEHHRISRRQNRDRQSFQRRHPGHGDASTVAGMKPPPKEAEGPCIGLAGRHLTSPQRHPGRRHRRPPAADNATNHLTHSV